MPNQRKNRSKTQKFWCPHCQRRLWRLGSQKHYVFYHDISEIKKNLNITRKKASFLVNQSNPYIDRNSWIEEFFCEGHGKIWMRLSKKTDGTIVALLAKSSDWECTTGTTNPNVPNPSVSEFSYRMSRGTDKTLRSFSQYQ